jgi:hypothetical protein
MLDTHGRPEFTMAQVRCAAETRGAAPTMQERRGSWAFASVVSGANNLADRVAELRLSTHVSLANGSSVRDVDDLVYAPAIDVCEDRTLPIVDTAVVDDRIRTHRPESLRLLTGRRDRQDASAGTSARSGA